MSYRDELERLARLQAAELRVRELRAEIDGLPAERDAAQAPVRKAEGAVKAAEARREDSVKEHRRLEGELQTAEAQVSKYRDQELQVRTNQALWALQAEVETVQKKISGIEEKIIEELEEADELSALIEEQGRLLVIAREVAAEAVAAIDEREKELGAELAVVQGDAGQLRGETEPDVLKLYDRVAKARGGIAVAEGFEGRCLACNVRLRPQVWVGVLNMSAPVQCDACKRVVFARDSLDLPSTVRVSASE